MRVCVERWVVSLGLDEFCSSKPRHAANNAVEERRRARESPCAGTKSAAASGKFCTLPQYAWRTSQERQSCLSSPDCVSPLTPLYQTLDLHRETGARAHWEMMGAETDESLVQVKFHPKNKRRIIFFIRTMKIVCIVTLFLTFE